MRCLLTMVMLLSIGRAVAREEEPNPIPVTKMTIRGTPAPVPLSAGSVISSAQKPMNSTAM